MSDLVYTTVSTPAEVDQILGLQARNLPAVLTPDVLAAQGFVTVRHDPAVLQRMNRRYPSVIAKAGDGLAGYCLVMLREFAADVPVLVPMFDMLDGLHWKGTPLPALRWFVMGQVCVAESYRGQGVFDGLYARLREHCRPISIWWSRKFPAATRAPCAHTPAWASSRCTTLPIP